MHSAAGSLESNAQRDRIWVWLCDDLAVSTDFIALACDRIQTLLPAYGSVQTAYALEDMLDIENPNADGTFYTPAELACYLVQNSISHLRDAIDSRLAAPVLDPACGAGVFLCALRECLYRMYASESDKQTTLDDFLAHNLFAVDRNPRAVALCRILLAQVLCTAPYAAQDKRLRLIKRHVIHADFLLEFSLEKDAADMSRSQGFSLILGNPPYGLSRNRQIERGENEALKKMFAARRRGKVNKYLLFMSKGYDLLAPNGIMSLIVPNAWLGIRAGEALRRTFLTDKSLESIHTLCEGAFPGLGVETVIFRVERGRPHAAICVHEVSSKPLGASLKCTVPVSACLRQPGFGIPLRWSASLEAVFRHIRTVTTPLGGTASPFQPLIALQAYSIGKGSPPQTPHDVKNHVYHCAARKDETCIKYLEGRDIKRYSISWSGKYLRYGPWLAEPQKISRFSGPRIVIREVLGPLPYCFIAAFVEEPYLYNKSVLHILLKDLASKRQSKVLLIALLIILNSKFASFVIRFSGRKSQRSLFPKLVNADLKDFPLPVDFDTHAELLTKMYRHYESHFHDCLNSASLNEIDQAVYGAYRLTAAQIETIESELRSAGSRI